MKSPWNYHFPMVFLWFSYGSSHHICLNSTISASDHLSVPLGSGPDTVASGRSQLLLRMVPQLNVCSCITSSKYPPTPADARGSAPGNKTFSADHLEACNSNSNSNSSSSSTLLCHGVFPSGTYVFAAASGRSSWQAAAEQPAVKKQVAGSQLSAARTQQTATATAAAAVLFFGCKLWEPSGQQQAAAGSGRQPAKRWCFAVSDVFRKGCLAVCFLLWRLFDCSSSTAAPQQQQQLAAAPAAGSSREQQGAAGSSREPQAAAGSGRQQQAAAGSSRHQQTPAEAAAGSSRQAAAGSSRQQQAAADTSRGSSRQLLACHQPAFRAMVFCCRELLFSMVFSYLGTGCKGS